MTATDESPRPTQLQPQRCVVIEADGKSAPSDYSMPVIPRNENSTRAQSRRNRVYVLRDFLHRTYHLPPDSTVLDVAGGRGDLSWILRNVDDVDSVVADPRVPNHRRLVNSVKFLLDHPREAEVRSAEGLPTHQPLAKLLPRLMESRGADAAEAGASIGGGGGREVRLRSPRYVRLHVDDALVEALRRVLSGPSSQEDRSGVWEQHWRKSQRRMDDIKKHYGGTAPKTKWAKTDGEDSQIIDSRSALEVFQSLDLIVGFHPDQATEATVDMALLLGIPFAVVPCCVFPSEFPDRCFNGKRVRTHSELLDYLQTKHHKMRKERLPFIETDTAKNVVLYMLKEDF
ncbi:hypothetical protein ACHAWF_018410 [Thalassiosira exigua]